MRALRGLGTWHVGRLLSTFCLLHRHPFAAYARCEQKRAIFSASTERRATQSLEGHCCLHVCLVVIRSKAELLPQRKSMGCMLFAASSSSSRTSTACSSSGVCGGTFPATPSLACKGALRARPGPSGHSCREPVAVDLRSGGLLGILGGALCRRPAATCRSQRRQVVLTPTVAE